jgi:hypothetical protein
MQTIPNPCLHNSENKGSKLLLISLLNHMEQQILEQMEQRKNIIKTCPVDPSEAAQCDSCQ